MKWPFVSRARYERELQMLREAYSVNTTELRGRLTSLIEKVTHIRMSNRGYDDTEIAVSVRLPAMVRENYFLSPFGREDYWWHVGQNIVEQLKAHAMLRDSSNLKDPSTPQGEKHERHDG